MAREYPLSLIIRAVDKATGPLREINQRLQKFTAPIRKLNNSFKALSDEAGVPRLLKSFGGVGRAISGVGSEAMALGLKLAGMATAATVGIYAIVKGAVDAGDKLGEMAQRVGLSVDAYAQLQFAAAQADVEQEAFNGAMDQFNKRLGEAKAGGGPLLAFLQQVAPGLANQVKAAKSTEEALGLMTDAFERVKDPGKRAALAAATFGKSGLQMGQFLGQGTKAIEEQRAKFLQLAGSQEEFAAGAGGLDNAMRETETAFLGLRSAAAGALFPALTELAQGITELMAGNRGALKDWAKETGAAISAWVKSGGIKRVADGMKEWAGRIDRLIDALGGLKGVAVGLGLYLGAGFIASVGSAIGALWNLGAAVVPMVARGFMLLWPMLVSGASYMGSLAVAAYSSLAPALATAATAIWGAATAMGAFMLSAAPFIAAAVGVGAAGYAIYKNWRVLMEGFTSWSGYINTFRAQLEMLLHPLEALRVAGEWWGKELGITGGPARQLNPSAALPPAGAAGAAGAAHVVVDFNNLPRGARVAQAPGGTADLDLSLGYSMVGP